MVVRETLLSHFLGCKGKLQLMEPKGKDLKGVAIMVNKRVSTWMQSQK